MCLIEKTCEYCGKQFQSKNKQQKFCCHKCHGQFRSKLSLTYNSKRLYSIWRCMINRCYRLKDNSYKNYGARGIVVCKEWRRSFENFKQWALETGYDKDAPRGQCTLDRINNNGNYEPNNCRWVSQKIQNNNKRTNTKFTINGCTHTVTEWCDLFNINSNLVLDRLNIGWDINTALSKKSKGKYKWITYKNETYCINEWARKLGLSKDTIKCRLKLGWDLEDVFNIPYKFDRLPVNLNGQINEIRYWAKIYNCSSLDFYKQHEQDICEWKNHKICQYCGKQFIAKTKTNKYCSNSCKHKAHRKINESNNK